MSNGVRGRGRGRREGLRGSVVLGLIGLLGVVPPAWAAEDAVVSALRDELGRSVERLQLAGLERPYFISYAVDEVLSVDAQARFGALVGSDHTHFRTLTVEVRVGGRQLDNSGSPSAPWGTSGVVRSYGGAVQLPLDDDYRELRRLIWLATDGAYKQALEDLARKRAYLHNRTRGDDAPDFSEEQPSTLTDETPSLTPERSPIEALARELSAVFRQAPDVFSSGVRVSVRDVRRHYVNSEGGAYSRRRPHAAVTAQGYTQAVDGSPLDDFVSVYARSFEDLPSRGELVAQVRALATRLAERRVAPAVETYNGPVLLEGQAAAEAFAQVFVPNLVAVRAPLSDSRYAGYAARNVESPFLDRIGARVLPESLSLTDNPLLEQLGDRRVVSGVKVDDEGIATREVRLVENGYLRNLLSTRGPVRDIRQSSGSRHGSGPLPTTLIVTPKAGLSVAEARAELLRRAARRGHAYGIVVRRIANPLLAAPEMQGVHMGARREDERLGRALSIVKLYPDGHEELVREADLSGINTSEFKALLATTNEVFVETLPLGPLGARGFSAGSFSPGIVSLAVPGLLFEEVSVKKPTGEIPRGPIVGHPFFEKPGR